MAVVVSLLRGAFAILFGLAAFQIMLTKDVMGGLLVLAGSALLSPPGGRVTAESIPFLKSGLTQIISACAIILVGSASTVPTDAPTSAVGIAQTSFSCEAGSPADGAVVQVIGADSHNLRAKPNGDNILNEKATRIIGSPVHQAIDNSTKVQVQCLDGAWARVQITSPEWLTHQVGWVQTSTLALDTTDGAKREFTDADFHWDADTKKAKAIIIKAVNRIHREDKRCRDSIYPASVAKSPYQTTSPSNPVFFVNCGDGATSVNVYFDADRANDPKPFTPPVHIAPASAIKLCEAHAKSQAAHPSTVSFSRVLNLSVTEHLNGRTTVLTTFTAKNSFNLELKYKIRCLLDGNGFIDGTINEDS